MRTPIRSCRPCLFATHYSCTVHYLFLEIVTVAPSKERDPASNRERSLRAGVRCLNFKFWDYRLSVPGTTLYLISQRRWRFLAPLIFSVRKRYEDRLIAWLWLKLKFHSFNVSRSGRFTSGHIFHNRCYTLHARRRLKWTRNVRTQDPLSYSFNAV